MESTYDRDARQLRLSFGSAGEIGTFEQTARRESGFLVTLPVGLKLHEPVTVELIAEGRSSTVEARVAQVFDKGFGRFGTALMVEDWTTVRPPTIPVATADEKSTAQPPQVTPEADETTPSVPITSEGEMRGTSPIHAVKEMNPRQRSMLAMKATRTQRKILLRDNSPQVLQNLLANPQIDSEEVLQIARSSHVVAPILQRIAGDARWSGNQEILATIARHPKTPSVFAGRLLPALRTSDLRMMAKMSSGLRELTRKAALREYMRRTGQRV